jgi:hypothetical protein
MECQWRKTKNRAQGARHLRRKQRQILLDLAFFVFDVLPLDGIVLFHNHLFGHGTGILLGHIEVPRASRRVQTDLDRRRFGHGRLSCIGETPLPREILEACLLRMDAAESTAKPQEILHFPQPARKPPWVAPVYVQPCQSFVICPGEDRAFWN